MTLEAKILSLEATKRQLWLQVSRHPLYMGAGADGSLVGTRLYNMLDWIFRRHRNSRCGSSTSIHRSISFHLDHSRQLVRLHPVASISD